jgi:hypothetical protein
MFDNGVINSINFRSLSKDAMAFYFLLNMNADFFGFVDPQLVMRMFGGFSNDDFNMLVLRTFIIPFPSGVVVITDWHKNNWLDSRRCPATEYYEELNTLTLDSGGRYVKMEGKTGFVTAMEILLSRRLPYVKRGSKKGLTRPAKQMLSNRLANAKQELSESLADAKPELSKSLASIEENSIEKNSIEENNTDGFSNEKPNTEDPETLYRPSTEPVAPPDISYLDMTPEQRSAYMNKYHPETNPETK